MKKKVITLGITFLSILLLIAIVYMLIYHEDMGLALFGITALIVGSIMAYQGVKIFLERYKWYRNLK